MDELYSVEFFSFLTVILLLLVPITIGTVRLNDKISYLSYSVIIAIVAVILGLGFMHPNHLKTFMCICFFLLCEFYELSGTYISFNRTPATPLPDYGFDILKERHYYNVPFLGKLKSDALINMLLMSLVISACLLVLNNNDDFLLLRRLLFMIGITALLRPFIFCMTSLPDPSDVVNVTSEEQKPEEISLANTINYTFSRLRNPKDIDTSGDMLFSGHTRYLCTAVCAYASMITAENAHIYVPLFLIALTVALYCCYLIVESRFHYSVDVFMAILIVVLLWLVINESSMIAEVTTDVAQLPYICRGLIRFMGWLSD